MSTPAKALKPLSQHNVLLITEDRRAAFESRLRQCIQDRAYQLFERNGAIPGQDQKHWFQAETELLERLPPVRESGAWCTANATLQNVEPQELQVLVLDDRAIVAVAKSPHVDEASGGPLNQSPAYLLIRWPIHVDPATAAAYLKGNTLVVTAKHSASKGGT
jgi:Protein of unknown function (DUF2934)